ncbi:glyoxalase-like domain-containing protein [Hypoxylon sp. NC1633]|nr:glyoxalase-like domain-containing protein [Hypoxylon sp. NC1633]
MPPSATTPLVDHIVILVPHFFLTVPPPWFAALFHLFPGGRHADGLTENTLVLLADGSYLEFIAFVPDVDPAARAKHHWGSREEGTVVDWAVTLPSSSDGHEQTGREGDGEAEDVREAKELRQEEAFREVQKRVEDAHTGIVYGDLVRGGRTRPDGEVLKWAVAFPKNEGGASPLGPGTAPFWCLDVTPRHLRVPYGEPGVAKHPSGIVGVAGIEVLTDPGKAAESAEGVYDALLGKREGKGGAGTGWDIGSLAGEAVHSGGVIHSGVTDGTPGVNISFFTEDESWVGKLGGGRVDEKHSFTFKFVAAFGKK